MFGRIGIVSSTRGACRKKAVSPQSVAHISQPLSSPDVENRDLIDVPYRIVIEGMTRSCIAIRRNLQVNPWKHAAVAAVDEIFDAFFEIGSVVVRIDSLWVTHEVHTV